MYHEIKTERLLLRPLGTGDLETTHAYAGDAETGRYMFYLPNNTVEETAEFLRNVAAEWAKDEPETYSFAITLNGVHIGAVSIRVRDGNMGWVLNKKYRKQGYATEAAAGVVDFARNQLRLPLLIAHCDSRNTASYRVMERIGMTLVGDNGTRTYRTGETARELLYEMEL